MKKTKINLLPVDAATREEVEQSVKVIRNLLYAGAFLIIIFSTLAGGYLYFLSDKLKKTTEDISSLRSNIKALEPTEQRVFLTKDRIQKSRQVLSASGGEEYVDTLARLVGDLPDSIVLETVELEKGKTQASFITSSSDDMGLLLDLLKNNDYFGSITLESFDYNPLLGYQLNLEVQL